MKNLFQKIFIICTLIFSLEFQNTVLTGTNVVTGNSAVMPSIVYPQINGILDFNTSTPAIQIQTDAGNFRSTKQFSIWGWFRQKNFFTFNSPSNIVTLQNVQNFSSNDIEIGPFPNPNFPTCLYTPDQIKENPQLKSDPQVAENPNCFPLELMNDQTINLENQGISITNDEILFFNYMLTNNDKDDQSKNKYELQFYLKNRDFKNDGTQSMKMYTIKDLPFVQNLWTFWAVSANYETGELVLYMRVFGPNGYSRLKNETLDYPDFQLNEGSLLLIAATNRNNYFKSLTGYIGEIAYIQMSSYFLKNVEFLWLSEMLVDDTLYDGVNSELLFDIYSKEQLIKSYGYDGAKIQPSGDFTPIYLTDKSLLGVKFNSGSSFSYPDFQYRSSPFVSSHPFLFDFNYKEPLPDEFTLLEKGTPGQSGYLVFKLVKVQDDKRSLLIQARSANKDFKWQSSPIFEENKPYKLFAGIVVSPNKTVHAVMYNNGKIVLSDPETDFENYDFSYKNIVGVKNSESYSGNITLNRLNVMDNFSPGILKILQQNNSKLLAINSDCNFQTDYFHLSSGCLECKPGVSIVSSRTCSEFCPQGFRNNGSGVCVKCLFDNCSDLSPLTWSYEKTNEVNTYRLIPSRPIKPNDVDISKLININIPGLEPNKDYTYDLVKGVNNEYVDAKFDFKNTVYDKEVEVKFAPTDKNILYDNQGNLLSGSELKFGLENICLLKESHKKLIKILAIITFFIVLLSCLLALLFLCMCNNKMQYRPDKPSKNKLIREVPNALWKFALHNWMKLQMIAFLLFINSPLPCCLRTFLNHLYEWAVSWAHGMGPVWNSSNKNNESYYDDLNNNLPPTVMAKEGIFAYLLHNMGVVFIFHLTIFVLYLVFLLIDKMKNASHGKFFNLFNIIHMNLIIIGYMMFHMMAFVFSFLNLSLAKFSTTYFIFSFIIAILYILSKIKIQLSYLFLVIYFSNFVQISLSSINILK